MAGSRAKAEAGRRAKPYAGGHRLVAKLRLVAKRSLGSWEGKRVIKGCRDGGGDVDGACIVPGGVMWMVHK